MEYHYNVNTYKILSYLSELMQNDPKCKSIFHIISVIFLHFLSIYTGMDNIHVHTHTHTDVHVKCVLEKGCMLHIL